MGKPLYADKMIALQERLPYVKLCVEIEVNNKLPKSIPMMDERGNVSQ